MSRKWLAAVAAVALVVGGVQVGRLALSRSAAAPTPVARTSDRPVSVRPMPDRSRPQPAPPPTGRTHRTGPESADPKDDPTAAEQAKQTEPRPAVDPGGLGPSLARAAQLATQHGLRAGIAVYDTRTGHCYTAGAADQQFGTASVVKVLIAAYLLANGELRGPTAELAYSMITRSDDDAANVLWEQVGGADIEPWIEQHYDLLGLGSPNGIPGRWGNTHVTPVGLVRLYAALQRDPAVWPWLGNAMHHAQRIAKDGTDQFFGLPAVASDAAVKQGWGSGSADADGAATVNSTGFLDHDRYAVAILTEGVDNNDTTDARGFNAAQASVVTAMARSLAAIAR